jgi:AraC-like DNA-binding protein
MLLVLIRIGDRRGARGVLNQMLASMFLYTPRFAVVKARAIEMMGFLVRAAVEESPLQEVLMNRHQEWVIAIVDTDGFESLCEVLRNALDDFIDRIALQGFNRTNQSVARALQYVADHFMGQVSLSEAARVAGLSTYRLAHVLKETTGYSLMQHVKRQRVQRATRLLAQETMSLAEIAQVLGFSDQSHFTRHFREVMGVTPKRWRN